MRKKGVRRVVKPSPNLVPQLTGQIVDAGGGAGRNGLTFDALQQGQREMFDRSLLLPPLLQNNKEQEQRQTDLVEPTYTLNVTVAREDYLDVEAPITLTFKRSASQAAWGQFIVETCEKLKINFLEVILDRSNMAQVHTTLSLREGGYYLARQRESSAVIDTISTGKNPTQVHWEITKSIITVKEELRENVLDKEDLDKRAIELITKPIICKYERDVYSQLVECDRPDVMIRLVKEAIEFADQKGANSNPTDKNAYKSTTGDKNSGKDEPGAAISDSAGATLSSTANRTYQWTRPKEEDPPNYEFQPVPFNENDLDIINIVRLAFETLGRHCLKGKWFEKEVATNGAEFIFTSLMKYIAEVDIVVLGLKLINDIMGELTSSKYLIFKVCLDSIEFYAPPSPSHRPRPLPKSRGIVDQLAQSVLELMGSSFTSNKPATPAEEAAPAEPAAQMETVKKDARGRLELVNPNLKEILDNNTKRKATTAAMIATDSDGLAANGSTMSSSLPTIMAAAIANANSNGSNPNTSRPSSRAGLIPTSRVSTAFTDYSGTSRTSSRMSSSSTSSSLPALDNYGLDGSQVSFGYGTGTNNVTDGDDTGYRLVRSINKGHLLSKKEWKGTSGKIGKKFVDESSLEYQMKLMAEQGAPAEEVVSTEVVRPKKKRPKAIIRPRMFRGYNGILKNSMALLQAFTTLYKLVLKSPKNREFAFQICLQDEISHIAVVCQNYPQVLEYILWIIDCMYRDRIAAEDFEEDLVSDPYSMQLSGDSFSISSNQSKIRPSAMATEYFRKQEEKKQSEAKALLRANALKPAAIAAVTTTTVIENTDDPATIARIDENHAKDVTTTGADMSIVAITPALELPPAPSYAGPTLDATGPKQDTPRNRLMAGDGDQDRDLVSELGDGDHIDKFNIAAEPTELMRFTKAGLPDNLAGSEWDLVSDITLPTVGTLDTLETPRVIIDPMDIELNDLQKKAQALLHLKEAKEAKEEAANGEDYMEGGTASIVFEDKKQIAKRIAADKLNDKERRRLEKHARKTEIGDAKETGNKSSKPATTAVATTGQVNVAGYSSNPVKPVPAPARSKPNSATGKSGHRPSSAASNASGALNGLHMDDNDSANPRKAIMSKPHEIVIIAVSMIGAHTEIENKEKMLCARWLSIWDDGSQDFQLKVRLGMSLSSV